jgi:hypothetical protein
MTREELKDKLNKMSDKEFIDFVKDFGGEYKDPPKLLRNYVDHPEWEPRICQLLGLQTEEERRTQAVVEAGKGAKYAAIAASISALISLIVLLITLLKK